MDGKFHFFFMEDKMAATDTVVICSGARTPLGGMLGALSSLPAARLGAAAIGEAMARAKVAADKIDGAIMGCVLQAGQGQAPARQAARGAGLPDAVPAVTVNKMCGSGMQALMQAHDAILAGSADILVAGGMESMSNAPYLLDRARAGYRMGHGTVSDHMFLDGLEDAYDRGKLMGVFAEECATEYQFTRAAQDEFALRSLERARAASAGAAQAEIIPVTVKSKSGEQVVSIDEQPQMARPEKIPTLKPAFRPDGTVTAANSSSISDGAAALILARRSVAMQMGLPILATVRAHAAHAQHPAKFTTAPIGAVQKLLAKTGWAAEKVDLFEINEAFAVVTLAAMRDLSLPADKVNVFGGACALGHPIGASGARIVVTLLNALTQKGGQRGIASACIGGGEATAIAIERE